MGTYDTLVCGDLSVQVKCFKNEMLRYEPGDHIPCDGSFVIVCPNYSDNGQLYAVIVDSYFAGITDCPPVLIDKWGNHLISYDDFKNPYEDLVQSCKESANDE